MERGPEAGGTGRSQSSSPSPGERRAVKISLGDQKPVSTRSTPAPPRRALAAPRVPGSHWPVSTPKRTSRTQSCRPPASSLAGVGAVRDSFLAHEIVF